MEVRRAGRSYTCDTLRAIHACEPGVELVFILGGDMFLDIPSWREPGEIIALAALAAAPRPGEDVVRLEHMAHYLRATFGARVDVLRGMGPDISSTEIRGMVRAGRDIFGAGAAGRGKVHFGQQAVYSTGDMSMTPEQIENILRAELKPKRFQHTLGVMATARELAEIHGENEARAQLAGLLHDNAKSLSVETMREIVRAAGLNVSEGEQASASLLHAPVGAYLARTRFGVTDAAVLDAITVSYDWAAGHGAAGGP